MRPESKKQFRGAGMGFQSVYSQGLKRITKKEKPF